MRPGFSALWHDDEGLTTVEYALLLAVLVVVGLGAWKSLGAAIERKIAVAGKSLNGIGQTSWGQGPHPPLQPLD